MRLRIRLTKLLSRPAALPGCHPLSQFPPGAPYHQKIMHHSPVLPFIRIQISTLRSLQNFRHRRLGWKRCPRELSTTQPCLTGPGKEHVPCAAAAPRRGRSTSIWVQVQLVLRAQGPRRCRSGQATSAKEQPRPTRSPCSLRPVADAMLPLALAPSAR